MKLDTKPLRGMRDFGPVEASFRQKIIQTIRKCFELFGFRPLETPALEKWEILSAKGAGGVEILKETYNFKDHAGRIVGLRRMGKASFLTTRVKLLLTIEPVVTLVLLFTDKFLPVVPVFVQ